MEFRSTRALRGRRLDEAATTVKTRTYGTGRTCAIENCGTLLSAYNPSAICALHDGAWREAGRASPRRAATRHEITRSCAFERCSREFTTTNVAKKYCSDSCRMKAFQARVARKPRGSSSERRSETERDAGAPMRRAG